MENKTLRTILSFAELLLLLIIVIGIPLYIVTFHREWLFYFDSVENIERFLETYQAESMLVYLGLQVFQVIVSVIPGQAVQFVAGYAFYFWVGYLLAIAGVAIGTMMTYGLSRALGRKAIYALLGQEKMSKYVDRLNSPKAYVIVFIIFLIPGLPKDLFGYAVGLSDMKFKPFLLISLIARSPAMMCTIAMGHAARTDSYGLLILLLAIISICFLAGLIWREKLIERAAGIYNKKGENGATRQQ